MADDVVLDPRSHLYAAACEPMNAIRFALSDEIEDPFDVYIFLKDWNEGVWWPEYVKWLKKNSSES